MTKTKMCGTCGKIQSLDEFCKKKASKDGLNSSCRTCKSRFNADHYKNNTQYYRDKTTRRHHELQQWWKTYKEKLLCSKCGFDHPAAIVFHHRNPENKKDTVSSLVHSGKKVVLEEIAKCDILCSNCHMILHYEERKQIMVEEIEFYEDKS